MGIDIERIERDCERAEATGDNGYPVEDVRELLAEVARLEALFQQSHGCHHSWVNEGVVQRKRAEAAEADAKAINAECDAMGVLRENGIVQLGTLARVRLMSTMLLGSRRRAEAAEARAAAALSKAEQYERDWYDAKSEFGTAMGKMRDKVREAEARAAELQGRVDAERRRCADVVRAAAERREGDGSNCVLRYHDGDVATTLSIVADEIEQRGDGDV